MRTACPGVCNMCTSTTLTSRQRETLDRICAGIGGNSDLERLLHAYMLLLQDTKRLLTNIDAAPGNYGARSRDAHIQALVGAVRRAEGRPVYLVHQ